MGAMKDKPQKLNLNLLSKIAFSNLHPVIPSYLTGSTGWNGNMISPYTIQMVTIKPPTAPTYLHSGPDTRTFGTMFHNWTYLNIQLSLEFWFKTFLQVHLFSSKLQSFDISWFNFSISSGSLTLICSFSKKCLF